MSTIAEELLSITNIASDALGSVSVEEIILPERMLSLSESNAKHDKFGLVRLDDGSCGFFYRLLDVTSPGQQNRYQALASGAAGKPVTSIAEWLLSTSTFERAMGLATVNALTQAVFAKSGFSPPQKQRNPGVRETDSGAVGMVGYFAQQIRTLRQAGREVFVLELDQSLYTCEDGLIVSGEQNLLQGCNTIYCTASTLINHSLENLLTFMNTDAHIELIGPSAGCFPEPLFSRGINVMGGSAVKHPADAIERVRQGLPWRDSVTKTQLTVENYPGTQELLRKIG